MSQLLAAERAHARGNDHAALHLYSDAALELREARSLYKAWGARAKLALLDALHTNSM